MSTRERPILFSGPMVRAILDGRKTQTRRVVNPQPREADDGTHFPWATFFKGGHVHTWDRAGGGGQNWDASEYPRENPYEAALRRTPFRDPCPYGAPGDTLWVRETWQEFAPRPASGNADGIPLNAGVHYRADFSDEELRKRVDEDGDELPQLRWRSPRFMPRWASRLSLRVTAVRVERLQEITDADVLAEGVAMLAEGTSPPAYVSAFGGAPTTSLRDLWSAGWDSINGKRAVREYDGELGSRTYGRTVTRRSDEFAWARNPWIWVVSFERVQPGGA